MRTYIINSKKSARILLTFLILFGKKNWFKLSLFFFFFFELEFFKVPNQFYCGKKIFPRNCSKSLITVELGMFSYDAAKREGKKRRVSAVIFMSRVFAFNVCVRSSQSLGFRFCPQATKNAGMRERGESLIAFPDLLPHLAPPPTIFHPPQPEILFLLFPCFLLSHLRRHFPPSAPQFFFFFFFPCASITSSIPNIPMYPSSVGSHPVLQPPYTHTHTHTHTHSSALMLLL